MGDAEAVISRLAAASQTIALAESCTAGLAADLLAQVPGASQVLWGSYVSYTEAAKIAMLGLDAGILRRYGAVSRETACAMALGALQRSPADIAAAVTGLAGPEGDGSPVPVGTVWIATAVRGMAVEAQVFQYAGSRQEVRSAAAGTVIKELLRRLSFM
ncbi:MAG: nicotinamide-nucleotide amidohydrolase family protein [Treponema sp.]|jgi:PncC family amidohydrolase|nr:nicotinamide-nucleotide amidohydrolase family protein [Treponema sp.]